MNKLLLFCFVFILGIGCKDAPKEAAKTVPAPAPVEQLAPLTNEFFGQYLQPVDYVDIVLYHQGFSMNISQPGSIQSLFSGLTGEAVMPEASCPAQGRIFFNSKGQTMTEADLHFIPNQCAILVFYIGGKKVYASKLNETGANIFNNYFANAAKMQTDLQQQQGQ